MSKVKTRRRSSKGHAAKALRQQCEAKKIDKLTSKLVPLMREAKPDKIRSFQRLNDLELLRLPNRRLNPRDKHASKRFVVKLDGMLRHEPQHVRYDPPLPVVVGAPHIPLSQLRDWRKDLKDLLRKLRKKAKKP